MLSRLRIGSGHAFAQSFEQLGFQLDAGGCQAKQALTAVLLADRLSDIVFCLQFAEHAAQRLLGDIEQAEQIRHRHAGLARDEIKCAVMRPSESMRGEQVVRALDQIGIAEIEQFDAAPDFRFAQEQRRGEWVCVSHVDISRMHNYGQQAYFEIYEQNGASRSMNQRQDMSEQTFDNRDGFIWFDGQLTPWRDAQIHVLTHALHYASSVFEGQRAYGGRIFRLSDHSQRLIDSARELGFILPWSREEIDAACNEVMRANNLENCYMRPVAWRGSEQMGVAAQRTKPHLAIAAWEWPQYFGDAAETGLRLMIAPWRRPAPYTAPTKAKAAGLYMICTLSKHEAEAQGYNDAMMLDWRGQVAEATGANLFFVRDGVIHTPTPDCFLDGITRRSVIDLARRRGIEVIERAIWPEELEGFEQAFLTGTAAEVTPIREIGPWRFEVGAIARQLRKDYTDLVWDRLPNH